MDIGISKSLLILLSGVLVCQGTCGNQRSACNAAEAAWLDKIRDSRTSEKDLVEAFNHLKTIQEPASFWTTIANDPKYSAIHRSHCVLQLFRRHVKPCITLHELARILDSPTWLHDEMVYRFIIISGYVPVQCDNSTRIFSIHVLPNGATTDDVVYLSISREIDTKDLLKALRGQDVSEAILNRKVVDTWPR